MGFSYCLEHARRSSCGKQTYLPRIMWDLTSPTRGWNFIPCRERWILNHWTTREVPLNTGLFMLVLSFLLTLSILRYYHVLYPHGFMTTYILTTSNSHPQPRPFLSAPSHDPTVYMISPPGLLILSTWQKWTLYSTLFLTPMSFCSTTFCLSTLSHHPPGYTN